MEIKDKDTLRFIDKLYRDLYKSADVLHYSKGDDTDKFGNLERYLDALENTHKRISETGRHIDMLKQFYYDRYVIKREDIPVSYYKNQEKMYLERGFGHVTLGEKEKEELQNQIIQDQKKSLDIWIDYFLSNDSNVYPFWTKYWAFQGMLKLGLYDKEKNVFSKRTKNTASKFIDLNREALSMSIDLVLKSLNKEKIEDKELEQLVNSGSFQSIYTYIITKVLTNNKDITKKNIGKWIKYNQGSDHMPLVNSLQGYNTGWCTAGEATAKSQLSGGDFYVYYTLDENNEYKVPRIAIRMEENNIGEIRGVAPGQNIESEMEKVVEEKIKDFPDKDKYYKKVNDMKTLTNIYNKHKNHQELTKEELRFLYEVDNKIVGFGYQEDPRIEEIISDRNSKRSDLANIFDCDIDKIACTASDIDKNTIFYYGDLDLRSLKSAAGLVLPQNIIGGLYLDSLISVEGLVLPQNISGDLDLGGLKSAEGLVLPENIGRNLYLYGLKSVEGLVLPEQLPYQIYLANNIVITPENVDEFRNNKKI